MAVQQLLGCFQQPWSLQHGSEPGALPPHLSHRRSEPVPRSLHHPWVQPKPLRNVESVAAPGNAPEQPAEKGPSGGSMARCKVRRLMPPSPALSLATERAGQPPASRGHPPRGCWVRAGHVQPAKHGPLRVHRPVSPALSPAPTRLYVGASLTSSNSTLAFSNRVSSYLSEVSAPWWVLAATSPAPPGPPWTSARSRAMPRAEPSAGSVPASGGGGEGGRVLGPGAAAGRSARSGNHCNHQRAKPSVHVGVGATHPCPLRPAAPASGTPTRLAARRCAAGGQRRWTGWHSGSVRPLRQPGSSEARQLGSSAARQLGSSAAQHLAVRRVTERGNHEQGVTAKRHLCGVLGRGP